MTPFLVFALLILVAVCATLYIMLLSAARDLEALEDFILYLDDGTPAYTMPAELRGDLAAEANDLREMRKEDGDE